MSRRLELNGHVDGGVQVVVVRGEVDMESAPQLLDWIQQRLRGDQAVTIDLADVTYMDSSGIAVLVQGLRTARKRRVDFRLRAPSERVLAVLELAHLRQLFTVDPPGTGNG